MTNQFDQEPAITSSFIRKSIDYGMKERSRVLHAALRRLNPWANTRHMSEG